MAYEVDDLAGAQAFAAAGIAVVLMHQVTVHTPPPGVMIRPLAESTAATRTIEAILPAQSDSTHATALVDHLARAAHALAIQPEYQHPPAPHPPSPPERSGHQHLERRQFR